MLIGANCSKALLPRKVVVGGDEDPFAIKTLLGWGITGNMNISIFTDQPGISDVRFAFKTSVKEVNPIEVNRMFDCEFIEKQTTDSISMHDSCFLKIMKEGLSIENGHIELPLPFKEDDIYFPDNKIYLLL